jgi:squalene-hopene/tetraprenyl-beta-curcumene cyclase
VEETALAVEALLASADTEKIASTVDAGVTWLVRATEDGRIADDSPIGFYFAKLWYHERLYPLIFAASALGRAM